MTNHQSIRETVNIRTMHKLIVVIFSLATLSFNLSVSTPQQQQQQSHQLQQQLQQQRTDLDRQLLRKSQQQLNDEAILPRSSSDSSANFQCPEQFGYYTDTKDCTKYYVCVFGEVLHESCTGGLRFSRELQTCDWPRNVDCPQQVNNSISSSNLHDSLAATTTSSISSSSSISLQQQPMTTATITTSSTSTATTSGQLKPATLPTINRDTINNEPLKGASLVFADEQTDPQQLSFDEAISPVITADGTIHLHDGSGGTFGLAPNHNARSQHQSEARQSVDVFVKPLSSSQSQLQAQNKPRSQQQQQQQQQQVNRQQQVNSNANAKQLQPASLPIVQANQQHWKTTTTMSGGNLMLAQNHNRQTMSQQSALRNMNPQFSSSSSTSGAIDSSSNRDSLIEPDQLGSSGGLESENVGEGGNEHGSGDSEADSPLDSIGAQADQESDDELPSGEPINNKQLRQQQQQQPASISTTGASYIPPVMAPNPSRQINLGNNQRQTSQLLSINNRQVDSNGQSFKPVVPTNNLLNQRNNQLLFNLDEPRSSLSPQTTVTTTTTSTVNRQANSMRQNQTQSLRNQHPIGVVQNERQSRMSNSDDMFHNQATSRNLNDRHQQLRQQQQPSLLQATNNNNDQTMSNNVNFNDSSKLIRLQASQFDSSFKPGQQQPQPQDSNSFFKLPARSQNVLFSQQQFGHFLVTDNGQNNNNNDGDDLSGRNGQQLNGRDGRQLEGNNNLPSSNSGNLLQQQRRPRPPKRQQIPNAGSSTPATVARRPQQLIDIETTTTGNQPTTTNSFLSPYDSSFIDSSADDSSTSSPAQTTTTSSRLPLQLVDQASRPLVASSTVDFQPNPRESSPLQPTIAPRRFNNNLDTQQVAQNRNIQRDFSGSISSQGQRSAPLLAPTEPPPSLLTTTTTTTTSHSTNVFPPTTTTTGDSNQEQDPQLVANRYLSSAIDALEAGQPFGTVDYDFDILNDNSTERRNPSLSTDQQPGEPTTLTTGRQLVSSGSTNSSNGNNLFNANPNANRQRKQQELQLVGSSIEDGPVEGENINLSSGQANGGQIGFNLRPQQQQQQQQSQQQPQVNNNSGRQKANGGQTSRGGNNQKQQTASQFNQDTFVNPTSQQQPSPQAASVSAAANAAAAALPVVVSSSQQTATGKKPRPTNKKINVNHEQAVANNRASTEPAKRPEPLFSTPNALQTATKCDNRACRLPDCKCGDTQTPGGLDPKVIPQVILLTFDDAVNDLNWEIYEELFTGRTNPNGCPILATFYVSHEWTDYGQVQTLYSRGHEMASHSITHSFGEKFSKSQWFKEVNGQREILNMYGGVKMGDVRGMRAPFLQIGGNKMFEMLYDANFTYDSSMPIFDNSPPLWPYTLDYQLTHECMITPCPTKSFPGVWEVGMTMWVDLRGGRCSMGDACSNPQDEDGVYEMLMKNFNRHYKSNRAPFGLFYHSAWFNTVHHRRGFLRFMGTVNSLSEVFFVTNWQMLQWMRNPTPLSDINSFEPWQCPAKNDRPPPCYHPSVCNVKSEHGTRFMKTCQPCPVNQQYPWVGSTGFKGKQTGTGGSG